MGSMIPNEIPGRDERMILSVNIIEQGGAPLISRYYYDFNQNNKELFAGFFAAITMFSQSALKQDVKDIRMGESKFYISSMENIVYVVEVNVPREFSEKQNELLREEVQTLMMKLNEVVQLYKSFNQPIADDIIKSEIDPLVFDSELNLNEIIGINNTEGSLE